MTRIRCALPWLAIVLACLASLAPAQDEDREGGIIGTGIVGTITHLGSIHVNDQHIRIDNDLEVSGTLGLMTAGDLRPGHVVAVTAFPDGSGWRAGHIRHVLSLVGPVEKADEKGFFVLGTHVVTGPNTKLPPIGAWVAVSGLWQGQTLQATRLDPVPKAARQARIVGSWFGTDTNGRDVIGTTRISGIQTQHLEVGDLVHVYGTAVPGGIAAERIERRLFDDPPALIQIEGYFSEPQPSGLYTLLGSGLVAYTDQPDMIDPKARVLVCGGEGRLGLPAREQGPEQGREQLAIRLGCRP